MEKVRKEDRFKIDVIITSPPYNIGKNYSSYHDTKKTGDYLDWLLVVAQKSFWILKPNGSFFLNIGGTSAEPLIPFLVLNKFISAGYKLQNTIHWIKSISIEKEDIGNNNQICKTGFSVGHFRPIRSNRYLTNTHEYIFHFTKTGTQNLEKLSIGLKCLSEIVLPHDSYSFLHLLPRFEVLNPFLFLRLKHLLRF